jgi:hypothetical protein
MKVSDPLLVARMRKNGIVNPLWTLQAARKARLPVAAACAFLEQESSKGQNVFGHDPTIFVGRGPVTEAKYREYKKQRGPEGKGGMQGVGPMQLTFFTLQDAADDLGGCWKPLHNMTVGFEHAAGLIRRQGLRPGIKAYNGSGPAADRYAEHVLSLIRKWEQVLGAPKTTEMQATKRPKPAKVTVNWRNWWKKFVFGDTDCRRSLLTKLANVAQDYGPDARVFIRSGLRSFAEQTALYQVFLRDGHPLTAKPGTSNHEARPPDHKGHAADCQLVHRNGQMVNIGADKKARELLRKRGLCLPVPGESWHVEEGNVWKA